MRDWQRKDEISTCGSVGCLAGWAVWLTAPKKVKDLKSNLVKSPFPSGDSFLKSSKEALEITAEQAELLFQFTDWPDKFQIEYDFLEETIEGRINNAKIAAARIDYFIENGGTK
jgi:hypothetical protein